MRIKVILGITAFVLCVAGNSAAQQPYDAMPQLWISDAHFSADEGLGSQWWRNFNDPVLDSLVSTALDANYNVAAALHRIEAARSGVAAASAALYPTFNLNLGWTASRTSGMTSNPQRAATDLQYFSGSIDMSWQIDVFGRVRKQVEAKKANVELSRAQSEGVRLSLAAEIATSYITLRTYQAQLEVARQHIESQQHILKMTQARHEAGLASMLDVSQAQVVLNSTLATIPPLEAAIKAMVNSISVLTGEFPGQGNLSFAEPRPLPEHFQLVGVGVPADLLRRRPDIVEAETTLAIDAANLGIAKKEFLPTLALNGSIGTMAHNPGDLFKKDAFTYQVAPTLSWTIFSGMARRAAVEQQKEMMMADIDAYNLAVATAVQEVDNAILVYAGTLRNIDCLETTVEASKKSLDLSLDLYRNSLSSFTNVVDAQMNLLTYQNSLVSARGNALKNLVNLYKALGGGTKSE